MSLIVGAVFPVPGTAFRAERTSAGSREVIALFGELDLAGQAEFNETLESALAARPRTVALDLRGLEFMDTNGLHAVAHLARHCHACGQRLFVVHGGPDIERTLELSGLASRFERVDTPDWLDDGDVAVSVL